MDNDNYEADLLSLIPRRKFSEAAGNARRSGPIDMALLTRLAANLEAAGQIEGMAYLVELNGPRVEEFMDSAAQLALAALRECVSAAKAREAAAGGSGCLYDPANPINLRRVAFNEGHPEVAARMAKNREAWAAGG